MHTKYILRFKYFLHSSFESNYKALKQWIIYISQKDVKILNSSNNVRFIKLLQRALSYLWYCFKLFAPIKYIFSIFDLIVELFLCGFCFSELWFWVVVLFFSFLLLLLCLMFTGQIFSGQTFPSWIFQSLNSVKENGFQNWLSVYSLYLGRNVEFFSQIHFAFLSKVVYCLSTWLCNVSSYLYKWTCVFFYSVF